MFTLLALRLALEITFLSCSHPLFTLLSAVDLFFQVNAGGTLTNTWVKLSGRLMTFQYVRLPPCWCCCCSGSTNECPIVGTPVKEPLLLLLFFFFAICHMFPPPTRKAVAGGTQSLLARLSREALPRTSDSLA